MRFAPHHTHPLHRHFALIGATLAAFLFLLLIAQQAFADQTPNTPDVGHAPEAPGSIAGLVTDSNGTPLAGITITAYRTDSYYGWLFARVISTTVTGEYKFSILRTGNYRLSLHDPQGVYADEFYLNKNALFGATDIPVAGNDVTGINITLDPAATITGAVTVLNEVVPDDSYLTLYTKVEDQWVSIKTATALTQTGAYSLPRLLAGVYRICAEGYWDRERFSGCHGGSSLQNTTDITVTTGEDKAGINITLGEGQFNGVISGTVTADGQPVVGIEAKLYRLSSYPYYVEATPVVILPSNHDLGSVVVTQKTNAQGQYTIGGLEDGTYRIAFADPTHLYATTYHNNKPRWEETDTITIENGSIIANRDATLVRAGRISGHVDRSNSASPANIRIHLWLYIRGSGYNEEWAEISQTVVTNKDGNYEATDLWPGDYRVAFESLTTYYYEYYGDARYFSEASKITVGAGATVAQINQTLGPDTVVRLPIVVVGQ